MLHPVSVTRFPSFRTQTLENLSHYLLQKTMSEQPRPWRKSCERESCYGDRVYIVYSEDQKPPHLVYLQAQDRIKIADNFTTSW